MAVEVVELGRSHRRTKRERLVARISAPDKSIISRAAALAGQSLGTFVVTQARKAALQSIAERHRIVLNAEQSRRFVEALLSSPKKPTRRMRFAMEQYKALVKSDLDQVG